MTHRKSNEMTPFELPEGFGDDDTIAPVVDYVGIDPREHALDCLADYADTLFGDIVLVPFTDGKPDWDNVSRDTITKFAGHWSEIEPEDVQRLGILTDSFTRFLGDVEGVSVVTLWRDGTPIIRQIDGEPCGAALDVIMDAIIDDEPLKVRPAAKPKEPPKKEPPKADNDNQEIFLINPADWYGKPVPPREWTTKKINYGKVGNELRMRWHDRIFVLDDGKPTALCGLLNRRHDEKFRNLLSAVNRTGQRVASTRGVNYAPAILAARPDAEGVTKKQFEAAMQRLLAEGIVKVVWEGPPSKQRQRLIVTAEDFGPESEVED